MRPWPRIIFCLGAFLSHAAAQAQLAPRGGPRDAAAGARVPSTTVIALGDSLTHGTMDGANNAINTLHAYMQLTVDSLAQVMPLTFSQPLFNERQERMSPFRLPTNLGVDGSNSFTLEGLDYYKRAGTPETLVNEDYLCDALLRLRLDTKYDKVMYPINVLAGADVSQMDAAEWLLHRFAPAASNERAIVVLWIGNNDSSDAALGTGGENPTYIPLPIEEIQPEINRDLRLLLRIGQARGLVSNDAYLQSKIERFLTDVPDFHAQYEHLLDRLISHPSFQAGNVDLFLLTLPHYSAVGYLFDSEDLEYYLRKLSPDYIVPPTFARVAPPGEPITDPLRGDRIAILTFGFMYVLLHSGYSVEYVNQVLEQDGVQRDDMVLSESEQQYIMARIDSFNDSINALAARLGPRVRVIDVGGYLSDALAGNLRVEANGRLLHRKWTRGAGFCLDGVHPGYTGQALIANYVLANMSQALGVKPPLYDLDQLIQADPYVDQDGDGWAAGPDYAAAGITEVLFLLTDPDDADAGIQVEMPRNVWDLLSEAVLKEVLGVPSIRREAAALGITR